MIVFYENHFVQEEEARIPVSDRGFQFGDGAFAVIQVRNGIPLFLEDHLEQLKKQCLTFNLFMPLLCRNDIERLIKLNEAESGIWRLKVIITGGDGQDAHLPARTGKLIMFIKPFTPQPFQLLNMEIFSTPYYSCHAFFKSLAHLNRFYVMQEATTRNVDDCVTVTENGALLEASFGNLFWIQEKCLMTPDPALPLYFGITIKNILKIAKELGFEIQFVRQGIEHIHKEATAFRTNTMQGIRPIARIDRVVFKSSPTIESLFVNSYEHLIKNYCTAYEEVAVN